MSANFRDASRLNWEKPAGQGVDTHQDLQLGAILRIADAVEKMAVSYSQLINERDSLKRWYAEEKQRRKKLERSQAALRGVVKRMKRKDGDA